MLRIYKGKNLEEVLNIAADNENIDPEYLNYVVIEESEEEITIGCTFLADVTDFAKNYLSKIVNGLISSEPKIEVKLTDNVINLKLEGISEQDSSKLIGENGHVLSSLTKIVRAAVLFNFKKHYSLLVDVNNYKDSVYNKIVKYAKRIATEVQKTRTNVKLHPMTSDERRVIHNALQNYHHIKTESYGEGQRRSIIIKYDANKTKSNN